MKVLVTGAKGFVGKKIFDIYILQCTKLKIGCLICKYRIFL